MTRRYHAEQLSWLKFEIKFRCEVCEVHYLSFKFILQLALFECQFNRKKPNCLNKIVWIYIILYYIPRYSLQWWCGIYLGPVWSKALCLGWHTGIVSWCLSMPAFHATTCWALGTSRHTHTWMIRENLNWFIFKFLKIPICNTFIEKDYVILLIVVYEVEQNFYSNGTLSRTNCVCFQ